MEKKEKIRININNGMKRLLKKLDINIPLSQLRELLKNDIKEEFHFIEKNEKENYLISENDEKDFILKDILEPKENLIYIKTTINKIVLLLERDKLEEIICVDEIYLNDLRKLSNKMDDNLVFIDKEEYEIDKEQEKEFKAKEILNDGYIKVKSIIANDFENKIIEINGKKNGQKNDSNENKKINNENNEKINENINENDESKNPNKNFKVKQNEIIREKQSEIKKEKNIEQNKNNEIQEEKEDEIINTNTNKYLKKIDDLSSFFRNIVISPELSINEIFGEYDHFKEKYGQFKGIKRFAIPVFGIISSGKSTFLNYILNLDELLEIEEQISTQFICIIRNKKGLKIPKLYSIKIVLRDKDKNFVNFIKQKEIPGDIKAIIKEKNKIIKESNIERKPEDYFLLIEVEIPFLSGSDYSDLFEFMDFPGLNESYVNENKINLFYKDYMPLILPNIKFPIFIFDVSKYEGIESTEILNYYKNIGEQFNLTYLTDIAKKSFNESIYILNKSDLLDTEEKKEEQLEIFRDKFGIDKNNSFLYNSKEKLLENNKFNSFYQFTEYIINDKKPFSKNFIEQLEHKLETEFNKSLLGNFKEEKSVDEIELKKFNKLVDDSKFNFNPFKEEEYLKYKNIFKNKIPKQKSFKDDNLTAFLRKKMNNIYDDFINLNPFQYSLKMLKENENKEGYNGLMKGIDDELFINNTRIFNPNQINKITLEIDTFLDIFLSISKDSKLLNRIKKENKNFNDFLFSNEISFKILLLGKYSSGKSSLLNSIIGYDLNILDISENECTKNAYVIKYCKNVDNISLSTCELKKNDFEFYYFEEKEEIVKGSQNVKSKIKELNKNSDDKKFEYYIVKTPIEIFDDLNLSEEIKNYIEFIDLPGLDVSGYREIIFFREKMIKFMDGLIYVNHGTSFEDKENTKAIINLYNQIMENKNYFSSKSLFFIYTFADKFKMEVEEFKKNVLNLIHFNLKKENFINILKQDEVIKEKDEILFSKFSNTYYREYQKFKHFHFDSINIKDFYEELKNNYFPISNEEFDHYNPNEEKFKQIQIKMKKIFNIKNENIFYKNSNAKEFFINLKNFILNIQKNYYKALTYKFKLFLKERVYFQLINLKFYIRDKSSKFISKEEAIAKISNIRKYHEECLQTNKQIFEEYSKKFEENISKLQTFCGEKNFEEQKKIFDRIMMEENENLKKKINKMIIEFNAKCFIEVKEIQNELFGETYLGLESSIDFNIKYKEFLKKGIVSLSGIVGGAGMGVGIYGVIAGGILNPVAGIVLGSIYLLGTSVAVGYRLFKGKKKVNEEYVNEHRTKIINIIINSKEEIDESIYKTSYNYKTKIEELVDLQNEDKYLFLKNLPKFENSLKVLLEYIKSTKNIV